MLLLCCIFALLVEVSLVTAPPSQYSTYRTTYTNLLAPLQLYDAAPPVVAPVGPPWRGRNHAEMQRYLRAIRTHDAYIDPHAGIHLDRLHTRAAWILERPDHPLIREYQRGLLSILEEAARQATWEMKTALHPVNVRAQYRYSLETLEVKLRGALTLFGPEHLNRISEWLNVDEKDRLLKAHGRLLSQGVLLNMATPLAVRATF